MSPRAERSMVPEAAFESYYGRPVIKPPRWKSPDVPAYLFLGGLAGSSATMAFLGELTGRAELARAGYLTAGVSAAAGTATLIHDLGRPARFLYMLRTVKLTSPLNTGSWILASFGTLSGAAAASTVTGLLPGPGRLAKVGAAALGPLMTSYTSTLFADTAVPAWHEAYRELPFVFAGGSLVSGAGAGLLLAPPNQAGPARLAAVAGSLLELGAERRMTSRLGMLAEPYSQGRPRRWMRAGRLLSAAGAAGAVAARRSRLGSAIAGLSLLAGALCTRFGIFEAGLASAEDPKYTVLPQRERLTARGARHVTAGFVPAGGDGAGPR